jgi:hypothetical protein
MLAVVWVTPDTLFLTDGILTIQTSHELDLRTKFRTEDGFDVQLRDLEGFVCLFQNCRIQISNGDNFQRPEEGELAGMFRKKDFRQEAKKGSIEVKAKGAMSNLEQTRWAKVDPQDLLVNCTVIDLEDSNKKKKKKEDKRITRRITKKKKGRTQKQTSLDFDSKEIQKKEDSKVNPVINFYLTFDHFDIICPYGKYFLTGKREMMVDSLSYEKIQFFERKFKLERHIKKMKDPENNTLVPVLELGDIIDEIHCDKKRGKKNSVREETRTTTSTPTGDSDVLQEPVKFQSNLRKHKRRSRRKRKV